MIQYEMNIIEIFCEEMSLKEKKKNKKKGTNIYILNSERKKEKEQNRNVCSQFSSQQGFAVFTTTRNPFHYEDECTELRRKI